MSAFEFWRDGSNIGGIAGPDTEKHDALAMAERLSKYGPIQVKDDNGRLIKEFEQSERYRLNYDY